MLLFEQELEIPVVRDHQGLLSHFAAAVNSALPEGLTPIRFAVTRTTSEGYHCEIGVLEDPTAAAPLQTDSIFRFVRRTVEVSDTLSGMAAGRVEGLNSLCTALDELRGEYDAVAISSVVDVPAHYHMDYFLSRGQMVNPRGGVEAMLTHALSLLYDVPSAHSPMFESEEIANTDPGVVDPRMAAEAVSVTFLQCILKGLMRSPRILTASDAMRHPSTLTASNISCLVIPDGCIGLPTLAALEQGIPVIAVRENSNLMQNDLTALPWATGQLHLVENYWEAAGVIAAMRAGIAPESVRRPLVATVTERRKLHTEDADSRIDLSLSTATALEEPAQHLTQRHGRE